MEKISKQEELATKPLPERLEVRNPLAPSLSK